MSWNTSWATESLPWPLGSKKKGRVAKPPWFSSTEKSSQKLELLCEKSVEAPKTVWIEPRSTQKPHVGRRALTEEFGTLADDILVSKMIHRVSEKTL